MSAPPTWRLRFHWLCTAIVVLSAVALFGPATAAAPHLQTTAELRDACEQDPNHVVVLGHSTKIFAGVRPPGTEQVASGCTLVLEPGTAVEVEGVSLTFAGPLAVLSAQKGEVKLVRSMLTATSMSFSLAGAGSAFTTNLSSLRASQGSLHLGLGEEGKVEIVERLLPGPADGLVAANMVQISGGRKLTVVLADASVAAAQGFQIAMDGVEGLLKMDEVLISVPRGSIAITASDRKSLVELHKAHFRFGDSAAVRLAGGESVIKLTQLSVGGHAGTVAPGGVTFEAGSGISALGKLEASQLSIADVASVAMLASRRGEKGELKLQKSTVSATGDLALETGPLGITEVKDNNLGAGTRIRVAFGPGGNCIAEPNNYSSTTGVVEKCP